MASPTHAVMKLAANPIPAMLCLVMVPLPFGREHGFKMKGGGPGEESSRQFGWINSTQQSPLSLLEAVLLMVQTLGSETFLVNLTSPKTTTRFGIPGVVLES